MPDIDITKLIAAAGIKQTPGVDDCYIVHLDQIEHVAALVLEEAAKNHDEAAAQWYRMTNHHMAIAAENLASDLRTIAEGLKP